MYSAVIAAHVQDSGLQRESDPIPTAVVNYVLGLPESAILFSRWVITRLSELGVDLTSNH